MSAYVPQHNEIDPHGGLFLINLCLTKISKLNYLHKVTSNLL